MCANCELCELCEFALFAEIAVCAHRNVRIEGSGTSHTSNSSYMLYGCGLNHIVITYKSHSNHIVLVRELIFFCQNGSLVAIGNFGTEFVHKAAKLRTMAAEPRKMAPAVRNWLKWKWCLRHEQWLREINYVKPFSWAQRTTFVSAASHFRERSEPLSWAQRTTFVSAANHFRE